MLESALHPGKYESRALKEFASSKPRRSSLASASSPLEVETLYTFNSYHDPSLSNTNVVNPNEPDSIVAQTHSQLRLLAPQAPGAFTDGRVVNTLPPELLSLIFEFYLETPSNASLDSASTGTSSKSRPYGFFSISGEYTATPLPLTHVCRSWRHAAVANQSFWSSVVLAFTNGHNLQDDNGDAGGEQYADAFEDFELFVRGKVLLLGLFLDRALDAPLSISFSASVTTKTSCSSFNRDFGLVHGALSLICQYSRTWKNLRVELGQDWGVEMFLELLVGSHAVVGGGFDTLQSLHLELAVMSDAERRLQIQRPNGSAVRYLHSKLTVKDIYSVLLQRSPHLTNLTLDESFFMCAEGLQYDASTSYQSRCPWNSPHAELVPWAQLKTLSINCGSISTRKVLDICSRTSALGTLKVRSVGANESSEVDGDSNASRHSSSPISLKHLRSLDVTLLSEPRSLFSALALGPRLEAVKVNVIALQTWRHFRRYGPHRLCLLKEILEPLDRMLAIGPSSPRRTVEVRCSVKKSCISLKGDELDAATSASTSSVDEQWMEENGLVTLAGCEGRVVEVRA